KNDLLDAVWPDVAVTESVLSKSIGELRGVLHDSFKAPRLIETVQRRGFRFIAPVSRVGDPQSAKDGERAVAQPIVDPDIQQVAPPVFVGRTEERQQLAALFSTACGGERQSVFITGPAGIGKTALVRTFLDSLAV